MVTRVLDARDCDHNVSILRHTETVHIILTRLQHDATACVCATSLTKILP